MTIIEVLFAIVILSGVMLALSQIWSGVHPRDAERGEPGDCQRSCGGEARSGPSRHAVRDLGPLQRSGDGRDATADPPMIGYPGYTRTTVVRREPSDTTDFTIVTVTVSPYVLTKPMVKTLVIGAF
jgi:hypothetical protein